jgi:DNA-binding NarL/FixJ family response regulator
MVRGSLDIFVKTVGARLRSIYSNLAAQSRVQLTTALRDRGEPN